MYNKIISLNISEITYKDALAQVVLLAENKQSSYVCFANAHMVIEAKDDHLFQQMVNSATYVFADGFPVAKSCSILYKKTQERIAGMDFFPSLLEEAFQKQLNVFFLGGSQDVLDKIALRLDQEYNGEFKNVGMISPPFGVEWDNQAYIDQINESNAQIVCVALGCPKQEKWMAQYSSKINAVLLGLGGAFPVYAEVQSRCPQWMGDNGLEWLYRLIQEPKRLFKRYFITNSKFVLALGYEKIKKSF